MQLPPHVARVLSKFDSARPTRDGWDARCPCPQHNASSGRPGDHHPSLRIAIGHEGRILIHCRVGCRPDDVLTSVGLDWSDLFPPTGEPASEPMTASSCDESLGAAGNHDLVDAAYRSILANLELRDVHRADLERRGMSAEWIDRAAYRSLRNVDRGRVAQAVRGELGSEVLTVPGFIEGEFGLTLAGSSTGLVIPVRDAGDRINALKLRRASEPKYTYVTSAENGHSSGSPLHVPLGVNGPAPLVRVTEGELKADICWLLSNVPTIGLPGVTQWRSANSVLHELDARTVIIAFDALDVRGKRPVFEETRAFWQALKSGGFDVEIEDWN